MESIGTMRAPVPRATVARARKAIAAAFVLAAIDAAGAAGEPRLAGLSEGEKAFLAAHPVIKVMADNFWAPLEYLDPSGKKRGVTIDIIARMEPLLGVRFVCSGHKTWAEGLEALARGELDMASSVVPTPSRREYLDFTPPYIRLSNAVYGSLASPYIDDLRLLKGKRVLVVKGYAVQEFLARDHPELGLDTVPDVETGVSLLSRGKADYLVSDMASVGYYMQRESITTIKVAGETPYTYELGMAARRDRAPLASILGKALAAIPEAEMRAIKLAYFSEPVARKPDWRPFAWAGGAALLLAAAALAWIKILAARVRGRTVELSGANERLRGEISARDSAEKSLHEALAAKELMLKELNHRIKNNFMAVLGLVRLSSAGRGEAERNALEETAGRIEAIAKVHEQLEEAPELGDAVDLGAYLADLADSFREGFLAGTAVSLEVEAESGIVVGIKGAVSIGFMVNELLMNARKHAFPEGRQGRIKVRVGRGGGGGARVAVSDDGVGMEPGRDNEGHSLGSTIVRSMAEGLRAALELDSAPGRGTTWTITLPS